MQRRFLFITLLLAVLAATSLGLTSSAQAQAGQQIYTDSLQNSWVNYSWCQTDFSSTDYVHTGTYSLKATFTAAWQAMYLGCPAASSASYTSLTFWINGGATNGRNLEITGVLGGKGGTNVALNQFIAGGSVAANTWRQVTVPLSAIGLSNTTNMTGFWIGDSGGSAQPPFYLDDIALTSPPPVPQTVTIDFNASKHAINPQIYGVAYASQDELADLNSPLNRWGGNATSRYNWLTNATNHASDWFFESIPNSTSTPSADADSFVTTTQAANAQPMMTIPTLGWVAKLGPNRTKTWSFSQAKYGAQTAGEGDAGNGVLKSGGNVVGNAPTDANQTADSTFAQNWVTHFTSAFGTAAKGGLRYYVLDNEPSLWHATHRDVHPLGATMSEIVGKVQDYAAKIKAADRDALIVGPEEWGWSGYFYSGYDQQYGAQHGWSSLPDRAAHNNQDYLPWLLSSLKAYDSAHNTKSLDIFSVHYYPQGGEYSSDTSTAKQLLRNRSTRSLWDPTYVDSSWIGTQVQLIPRLKSWVAGNYAGLKTAITEYNWGAESSINGATTQADLFGIFGREGLDMATRWTLPAPNTPTYKAMKMYRNVDGANNGFGDVSVSDVVSDCDTLSSFASLRSSDGAQTVMVINKALSGPTSASVTLSNVSVGGAMQTWQLTASNAITRLADTTVPGGSALTLSLSLPAQSVTLLVIPKQTTASAALSGLYNTGVDNNNTALADGSSDAHYSLVSTPSGSGAGAYVTDQHWPLQSGVWMADTGTSKWLSPQADESKQTDAVGDYTYQTTFTVTGSVSGVQISGQVLGDDQVSAIILNGVTMATNISNSYSSWSSFSLAHGFVAGTNTLQFVVHNAGTHSNPTGFRCEMTGSAN